MQFHNLQRKHKLKKMAQVGRGGKRGKTSGRGTKGQKARAGHKIRPEFRDVIMRTPKLRGYDFKTLIAKPAVFNLNLIEKNFKDGEEVNPANLVKTGLLQTKKGKTPKVKILGDGEITKKITISGCAVSASAKEKIIKSGGQIL